MTERLPDFVVAGAARAGSTAVVESLRAHPDVFVTQPKEPHYLAYGGTTPAFTGPGDDVTINRVTVSERAEYVGLFEPAPPGAVLGEGSVSTLYRHEVALPRLRDLNPAARVVVILRDPVDRAFSSHQYLRNRGFEPEGDFLTALEQEPARRDAGWHHLWHYIGMSKYAAGVRQALELFGGDQVLVCWYDDLVAREQETLDRIHEFVGADSLRRPATELSRVNASGSPKRAWVQHAMHRSGRSPSLRWVVKRAVPFTVRERIRNANLTTQAASAETRALLRPVFDDDLAALEQMLHRPLPAAWREVAP
ncbi:MAG TPA: sulfotransferase [Nocardioidaceae bacterium]|nr:sulfotransferase [Nocardioidaceae bacterium]